MAEPVIGQMVQVLAPRSALVSILRGTDAGDQCMSRLGIDPDSTADGGVPSLDALMGPEAGDGGRVVASARLAVARSDRCVQISADEGELRAVLVFDAEDQVAVLAMGSRSLRIGCLSPAEFDAALAQWAEDSPAGGLHASVWVRGEPRGAVTMGGARPPTSLSTA